jgi:hypothetical protein
MSSDSNRDMPKLIDFLKTNEYELENVKYNPGGGSATAIFSKMAHIDEINGNDVNDATINITIDFDTRFDYKNGVDDEEEGMVYDFSLEKAKDFINKLSDKTYGGGMNKSKGGKTKRNKSQGKNKRRRIRRKTRKNRKH